MYNKEMIFDINIDNVSIFEAIEIIDNLIKENNKYSYVLTPNVDHVVKIQKDKEFHKIYKEADLVLADGMPIVWVSKILKRPLKEKVSGSDLFPKLCGYASEKGYSVFFLGGLEGVAQKAAEVLKEQYPKLNVVGTYCPPFGFENDDIENQKIIQKIKESKPSIIFVGVGAPKQEKWIYNNIHKYQVPVSLGIGASFDFVAGTAKRAPVWMQNIGLEWFYRFINEPRRMFKRYFIDDMKFINILLKEIKNNFR